MYYVLTTKNSYLKSKEMEIESLKSHDLRNEEHYQFHTETSDLVSRFTAEALGIQNQYAEYLPLLANEGEALDVVRKSALTTPIAEADHKRDSTNRGMSDTIIGATHHFNPAKREAADRLKIVLDHFGNINTKPYNEQTAAIKALVNDLKTTHADDVAIVGVTDWVDELELNNNEFEALQNERYSDEAGQTQLKMKEVRIEVDSAYETITKRINALVVVNGPEAYEAFIKELNKRIENYNNTIAQRKGRSKKDDEPQD